MPNDQLISDKSTTALVVIDLQEGIVARPSQPHTAAEVVKKAATLAQAFRKNGLPVFLVHVTPSPDGKDRLQPLADQHLPLPSPLPPRWSEIVPEMHGEGDFVITKRQWGAFYGTDLDLELRRRGIRTIVLCGISTNIGVESTARDAYERGYQQIFVEDAMTARSTEEHRHSVQIIFSRIGRVRNTDEILSSLQ